MLIYLLFIYYKILFIFGLRSAVLGIELRASQMLGKASTSSGQVILLLKVILLWIFICILIVLLSSVWTFSLESGHILVLISSD